MSEKIYYRDLLPMRENTTHFTDVIYNNFLNLRRNKDLKHTKTEISRLLVSQKMYGFLIYNNAILIGYLVGEMLNLNDGRLVYYINYLYVAKKYRKKGLGEQLVKLALRKSENIGLSFVVLTCDTYNQHVCEFYKKRGFILDPILSKGAQYDVFTYYLQ